LKLILERSECCEFHNFSSKKDREEKENLDNTLIFEKDEEKIACLLRLKKKRSKIMGLYENDFPKDYNGTSLIHPESDQSFINRVTRKSLSKNN
jgi:hypothetical protein